MLRFFIAVCRFLCRPLTLTLSSPLSLFITSALHRYSDEDVIFVNSIPSANEIYISNRNFQRTLFRKMITCVHKSSEETENVANTRKHISQHNRFENLLLCFSFVLSRAHRTTRHNSFVLAVDC